MSSWTRRPQLILGAFLLSALVLAACGDDGGSSTEPADRATDGNADAAAADIDVCALLDDAEMTALVGRALPAEPLGPESPYIGCSWNTGSIIVQVDVGTTTPVTAPGQECSPVDLGDEALECAGAIQFITHGNRIRVSSDGFEIGGTPVDVLAVATELAPKFESLP